MSFSIEFENRDVLDIAQIAPDENLKWMMPVKKKALQQFQSAKFPGRKVEHWKYNDLTFLSNHGFRPAQRPLTESIANSLEFKAKNIEIESAVELVFFDGFLVTSLNSLASINGLTITNFDKANDEQRKLILSLLDPEYDSKNLLINLNEAIGQDGLLIEVAQGAVINEPIYLRYFSSDQNKSSVTSQTILVNQAKSSQLTLIEQFESSEQTWGQLALQQTSINLQSNSLVNHYRLNLEAGTARQVSQVKTTLAKDSVMNSFYFGFGSRLNRTDINVIHAGEHAECNLTGIYLPAKEQTIDYHSNIEHRVPRCESKEVFRGIIADKARATFNGKIHIFQDAQKSNAYLNNKNLLLTNQAEVNTKPELEIYADDVACAHGATVAQLDDKSVYYLQSRGISRQRARKMLSIAFIQELLNQVKHDDVKNFLTGLLDHYMSHIE